MKRGKKYNQAATLIETNKVYSAKEACELVKKTSTTKFDASVDVAFNLNIDTRYAEQQIRGAVVLPNGTGKTKRVLAITNKTEEAPLSFSLIWLTTTCFCSTFAIVTPP